MAQHHVLDVLRPDVREAPGSNRCTGNGGSALHHATTGYLLGNERHDRTPCCGSRRLLIRVHLRIDNWMHVLSQSALATETREIMRAKKHMSGQPLAGLYFSAGDDARPGSSRHRAAPILSTMRAMAHRSPSRVARLRWSRTPVAVSWREDANAHTCLGSTSGNDVARVVPEGRGGSALEDRAMRVHVSNTRPKNLKYCTEK